MALLLFWYFFAIGCFQILAKGSIIRKKFKLALPESPAGEAFSSLAPIMFANGTTNRIMKANINQDNQQRKYNRPATEGLSVKDAVTWFVITVAALCFAGKSNANNRRQVTPDGTSPIAYNIITSPLVQASTIDPFNASATGSEISSYTILTIPMPYQGVLGITINGIMLPVSEGMMITADLVNNLAFTPDTSFTGDVIFTYCATDEEGNTSNAATYTIPVIGRQQVVLPVRLLQFSGTIHAQQAQLYWQTQDESNNTYYELQRSADGIQFQTVITLPAQGHSKSYYTSSDDISHYSFKNFFYRLKLNHHNGTFSYSSVVHLQKQSGTPILKAWPQPFSNSLTVNVYSEHNEIANFSFCAISGLQVMSHRQQLSKGMNTIVLYQAQTLPAGTYLLSVSGSTKAETIKVIKQ